TVGKYAHSLIKFDLSSLPANATIISATLSLWTSADLSNIDSAIQIYRLKTPFVEGQVTWNRSATGMNWQSPGASGINDREMSSIGSIIILANEPLNTEKQIGLDPVKIQEWVNGSIPNNGFILVADTKLDDRFNYKTSETSNAGQRPRLVIQYTTDEQTLNALSNIPTATPTNVPDSATPTPTETFMPLTSTPTIIPATNTPMPTETVAPSTETPAPSVEVTYDNTDPGFVYSPEWTDQDNTSAFGSSFKQTTENAASVTFTFSGTSFSLLYTGGPAFRSMDVYVDDLLVGKIDQKTDSQTYQLRWDYTGQLEFGPHILKLVFSTDDTTSGTTGSIDAVIIR
ncbi:MAG: DNRLRE domain-containing protein, partial [Flavobacteriales bacterium]|nr:DNRLRE domain-containing protein [Flavobacteriales bacterium]